MKTWFITGTSTGFGRALAQEVLAAGDQVVATARDLDQIEDLVADHDRALGLALEITAPAQVRAAVAAAEERFGGIDVLVNNAGIGYFAAVEESTDFEIRRIFDGTPVERSGIPGEPARGRGRGYGPRGDGTRRAQPVPAHPVRPRRRLRLQDPAR